MTVHIGEHFERMMADLITGGRFQNQSEVIRAGLRLLEEREYGHEQSLENELLGRIASPSKTLPKNFFANIKKRGRGRLHRQQMKNAA